MAHTIKVKRLAPLRWKMEDCIGFYAGDQRLVALKDTGDSTTEHAFCHELTHSILASMGHPLNQDEAFVDNFSGLLHQALSTAKDPRQPRRSRKGKGG